MGQITGNHRVAIDALEEKAIESETYQCSKNLLFMGIPEDGRNLRDDCLHKNYDVLEREHLN
jgi:hypothetical protein